MAMILRRTQKKARVSRRTVPARPPSRVVPAILVVAIAAVGFVTLMIRLEATREGYRLSTVSADIAKLQDENRALRLQAAQLSSHARLRTLAAQYRLAPAERGQVVMMP
ncbi:MAG TPA: hypothetical protein VIX59_15035 [Candidatus Binataceae bacterium]